MSAPVRYRFGAFVLSPRRRVLTRDGRAVPLIPKYFDVLLLLVRRRDEAVSKGEIFDDVWRDVVVSDGALSQAVRTLRRVLEDEARDPRYIRTVSRHGYQFVWAEVVEEPDDAVPPPGDRPGSDVDAPAAAPAVEGLVDRLLQAAAAGAESEDDARAIAAELHQLGTRDAVARLVVRPRHARALAIMRDARWSVPAAEAVPLLSDAEAGAAVAETVWLRLRAARPALLRRWGTAAGAGAAGGAVAGFLGGGLLMALTARATWQAPVALAAIGGLAGGAGAAGLAAGLSLAEAAARSHRRLALTLCTGAAGLVAGGAAQAVVVALAIGLAGVAPGRVPGAVDGLVLGLAAGVAYGAFSRGTPGGALAAPRGARRVVMALGVGLACAAAAVGLSLAGRPLVGGLVHEIARASASAELALAPLGRLLGEPEFGRATQALLAAFEGASLGVATTWGVTSRPPRRA